MKIMMAASESLPFSKTGGLADVVYSLSEELASSRDNEVSVFTPFYSSIDANKYKFKRVAKFRVHMGTNKFETEIYRVRIKRIVFYLVKNDNFFGRENIYGYFDDGERFAYFCNALLKFIVNKQIQPDIIHCHDWQTGMIPCVLKERADFKGLFDKTKTVFTIHNPLFKGFFDPDGLGYLYRLDRQIYDNGMVKYDNAVSTFKAALVYADKITTVSPTHAKELLTRDSGFGIEELLKDRKDDFVGILNGLDYGEWNPKTDSLIKENYGLRDFEEGKARNKFAFVRAHLLEENRPIFSVISRLTEQKGINQIITMADYIVKRGGILVILGSGEKWAEDLFRQFREKHKKHSYIYLGYYNELAHQIYASSDFILMPSLFEPCGLTQIIAQKYGSVPIVRKVGGLADTVVGYNKDIKNQNDATGIMFEQTDKKAAIWALRNAFELYKHPKKFKRVRKNCMKLDWSRKIPAVEYYNLYIQALKKN